VEQARHGRGKALHEWHREVIRLRREHPALRPDREAMEVIVREKDALLCVRRRGAERNVLLVFHLGTTPARVKVPFEVGVWRKMLDSADERWLGPRGTVAEQLSGPGEVELALLPRSAVIYRQ
jgi:maltooligosyltrehalose trehalohydrolase